MSANPKPAPMPGSEPDWKALALEAKDQLIRAITHFRLKGAGLFLSFEEDGSAKTEHWREMFADTLDKFPGIKVNRELLHAASWTKKQRADYAKREALTKTEKEGA